MISFDENSILKNRYSQYHLSEETIGKAIRGDETVLELVKKDLHLALPLYTLFFIYHDKIFTEDHILINEVHTESFYCAIYLEDLTFLEKILKNLPNKVKEEGLRLALQLENAVAFFDILDSFSPSKEFIQELYNTAKNNKIFAISNYLYREHSSEILALVNSTKQISKKDLKKNSKKEKPKEEEIDLRETPRKKKQTIHDVEIQLNYFKKQIAVQYHKFILDTLRGDTVKVTEGRTIPELKTPLSAMLYMYHDRFSPSDNQDEKKLIIDKAFRYSIELQETDILECLLTDHEIAYDSINWGRKKTKDSLVIQNLLKNHIQKHSGNTSESSMLFTQLFEKFKKERKIKKLPQNDAVDTQCNYCVLM